MSMRIVLSVMNHIDKIRFHPDTLTCNAVGCPRGSKMCEVYVTTKRHKSKIATRIKCLGDQNKVLSSHNSTVPNFENLDLNDFTQTALDGYSWTCNGCTGNTPDEILVNMQAEQVAYEDFHRKKMEAKWQQENDRWSEVLKHLKLKRRLKAKKIHQQKNRNGTKIN